jgi:hypothetical protein
MLDSPADTPPTVAELVRRTLKIVRDGITLIEDEDTPPAELVMVYAALMEVRGPLAARELDEDALDRARHQGRREGYEQARADILAGSDAPERRPLRLVSGALATPDAPMTRPGRA